MRPAILKRAWRAFGQAYFIPQSRNVIVMAALLLATTSLFASPTVTTLGGGNPNVKPKYLGYSDGNTLNQALFHTPCGLALDSSGQYLFVADRDNNAVRFLDLVAGWTWTFDVEYTNLLNKPIAVAVDTFDYVTVLNRGNVTNGSVVTFDNWGDVVATNAVRLTNAAGMAMDTAGNIYVTVQSNKLIRIAVGTTNRTTIATIPNAGTSLQGITIKHNGLIAACDSGRNGIYLIDPATGIVITNAGFHGTGDFNTNGNNIASSTKAMFNQPMCVAETGDGTLVVTDNGNNRVKAVLTSGVVTNLYGVTLKYWGGSYPGWYDGSVSVPDSISPNVQGRLPFGIVMAADGSFYTTEDYYHTIRHVTGASLMPPLIPPATPLGLVATAGYGQVVLTWESSNGATNYNIKRSTVSGGPYTNNIIGTTTGTTYTDTNNISDNTTYYYVVSAVNAGGESIDSLEVYATPILSPVPAFLSVTTNFSLVSLTWSVSAGATSYNLRRAQSANGPFTIIASPTTSSYNDTGVTNGATYYYVVTAVNPGGESAYSLEISATPPLPPVPDPQIGYVDFPATAYTSVFHSFYTFDFFNDALIVINGSPGSEIYYTYGYTNSLSAVPDPTTNSFNEIPGGYQDGLFLDGVKQYTVPQEAPYLVIKAIGAEQAPEGGSYPNSAVVPAVIHFITSNPSINGVNAAQFTISDITTNAHLYYTLDGSDPSSTNPAAYDLGTSSNNLWTVSFPIQTNTLFKAIALRNNFQPSAIVTNLFTTAAYVPNIISFGFYSGEASSAFVASPGQTFYAPVTLTTLPNTVMDSLQFNLKVDAITNIYTAANSAALTPGAIGFQSMLMKPDLDNPPFLTVIPPFMYIGNATGSVPPGQIITYEGTNFVDLEVVNDALNTIAVGWMEVQGHTNLFITTSQNLLTMSEAHDDVFPTPQQPNGVIVGGYSFQVPTNAMPGDTYMIQIGRPSATTDGIGEPGSSVFIFSPTNGSLGAGSLNAIKIVTVGQEKYIVGDAAPFRWFNAGDFGDTNLDSSDVVQVFDEAVYGLGLLPAGCDLFDSMDSCGNIGTLDGQTGYYTNNFNYPQPYPYTITNWTYTYDTNYILISTTSNILSFIRYIYIDTTAFSATYTNTDIYPSSTSISLGTTTYYPPVNPVAANLYNGNDTNIDQMAFGDGVLDVADVYVTFRRSEFTNLVWFRRYWTNDVANGISGRVAEIAPNVFNPIAVSQSLGVAKSLAAANSSSSSVSITNQPKVVFTAGDCQTNAGSTIQIPITANIFGPYPLRLLMLNLSVVPLDGSPLLTTPVTFSYNPALGSPWRIEQRGNGNYSAVWLNSGISGLSNNVTIGTLTVTLPAGATSLSAYAVHFDHASASPNGLASFPRRTTTGLITFSSRTNSSWGDAIPDSWRLRYFLTLNNILSATNADADGDGMNNLQEYLAGTDPTDPTDFFNNIGTDQGAAQQPQDCVISWPSVSSKQYVIERSPSLSTPIWIPVSTNNGTGTMMEFHDTTGGNIRFYRVHVQ